MKERLNVLTNREKGKEARPPNTLRVLIVGDSEASEDSQELLDSLTMVGYHVAAATVVIPKSSDSTDPQDLHPASSSLKDLRKRLRADSPDILILTTEGEELRKSIVGLISPQTEFLDPFVLKIIRRLKDVSRELASARAKLQTVRTDEAGAYVRTGNEHNGSR